jgi:hypothetical protein
MRRRFLVLSLLLVPQVGCDSSTPQFWKSSNQLLPMVALDDRVAYVESNSHTAYLLDPADTSFKPRFVTVGKAPIAAVKHNGANQMLVLSNGDSGSASVAAIPPQLQIVDANPSLPADVRLLAGRFDGLAQSGDGRFVVLYHSSSTPDASDTGLFNPNEMTIIDFTLPKPDPKLSLPTKSIRSLGGVPTRIEFSPPLVAQSGVPALAVVLSQNYVTILDLDNTDRTEISVPLCAQTTGCNFSPDQILFGAVNLLDPASPFGPTNPKILNIYVRAGSANDIFQIALNVGTTPSDFHASLSMLSVGANPASMLLYGSGTSTRLAVLAPTSKSLVIIDPTTSHTLNIATSIPTNVIVPFTVLDQAGAPKNQAMLVDTLYGSTSVLFADLEQVENTGGLAISDSPLRAAAADVWPLVDQGIAVLVLGKYGSISSFTVVEFSTRRFVDITASSAFGNPYLETRNPSRLWGVSSGTKLNYFDLVARSGEATLAPASIWLDQNVTNIQALDQPSTVGGTRYLVVGQDDPYGIGNLTFLDADKPDRATARTAYGFLFSNYLDRGQP